MTSMHNAPSQPAGLRLMLYANILFWGVQLPFGLPGLNVLLTLVAGFLPHTQRKGVSLGMLLFSLCLIGYGLAAYFAGPCTDGVPKVVSSLVVLLVLLVAINWVAAGVRHDLPLLGTREAAWLLGAIACAAVLEYLVRIVGGTPLGEIRVGGFYLEPSHLALSGVPLFCYVLFCGNPGQRFAGLVAALLLMVVGYSSTLIILLLILAGVPYLGRIAHQPKGRSGLLILACLVAVPFLVFLMPGSQDTLLRITDIVDLREDSNLSSLVYANGWMMLESYFDTSGGLGLGFNAMGCEPRALTLVTGWLELLDLGDQNYNDGSFLLSKIGSEFGAVGIAGFIVMAGYAVKQLLGLLRIAPDPTRVLCTSWIAIVFVGGIIRSGGGYFSGPVLLCILALLVLGMRKRAGVAQGKP